MSELLLGIDVGTASTKGVLVRPDGTIVATASSAHGVSMPHPGWAEHDAEELWWNEFVSICRELLQQAHGQVVAVCASGIGACLLPADAKGIPLRSAILYGIDSRAASEIEELNDRYGQEELLARCGSVLTTQAVGPKLLWLERNEPEVWERTEKFFMVSSFIAYRLTGQYVLDHHSASQCDPLYDVHANVWIEEWASDIAPGLPLPSLLWPAEIAGEVTRQAAEETGLPAGTPVAAGTIDAWSEGASVGVQSPGDLMLMYGTTMFMIEILREPLFHPGLWGTAGLLPGTHNLAAGMATSGALTGWIQEVSSGLSYEELTEEAGDVPPGSNALVILPYFAGERTPLFDPDARGLISGLTIGHRRGHLYRAMLEATAYGVRHILGYMREAGGGGERFVAVGGGTKGGLWTQIVSDVTGCEQQLPEETIGAAYGDALLAARAVGLVDQDTDWSHIVDTVEPQEANRGVYDELYGVYRELYPATREQIHKLAKMQQGGSEIVT
ncbi:FGGY-family carbohydrate kinase [soil metagenome]